MKRHALVLLAALLPGTAAAEAPAGSPVADRQRAMACDRRASGLGAGRTRQQRREQEQRGAKRHGGLQAIPTEREAQVIVPG